MRSLRRLKLRRQRRKWRSGRKLAGTPERPRLTVFRSGRHIYCQIVDDTTGRTLGAASTLSPQIRETVKGSAWSVKGAAAVGALIAQLAAAKGIVKVCFDRNGYRYHGRIKALAESARKSGLSF
jgi:large subunit ribosomal protein L18